MGGEGHYLAATSTYDLDGTVHVRGGGGACGFLITGLKEVCTARLGKRLLRRYCANGPLFPLAAILRVDHSVVDLETIEALYENVRIEKGDGYGYGYVKSRRERE